MAEVVVNGELKNVQQGLTLAEFIADLDLPSDRIAVELNLDVVRKSSWKETILKDQDRIEIVHFVGGG